MTRKKKGVIPDHDTWVIAEVWKSILERDKGRAFIAKVVDRPASTAPVFGIRLKVSEYMPENRIACMSRGVMVGLIEISPAEVPGDEDLLPEP